MFPPGTDGGDAGGEAVYLDGGGRVVVGAVTEPTIAVVPPAFGGAVDDGAGVFPPGTDGGDAGGEAVHLDGGGRVVVGAVTELTRVVVSPALGGAIDDGAGMELASGQERLKGAGRVLVTVGRDQCGAESGERGDGEDDGQQHEQAE